MIYILNGADTPHHIISVGLGRNGGSGAVIADLGGERWPSSRYMDGATVPADEIGDSYINARISSAKFGGSETGWSRPAIQKIHIPLRENLKHGARGDLLSPTNSPWVLEASPGGSGDSKKNSL